MSLAVVLGGAAGAEAARRVLKTGDAHQPDMGLLQTRYRPTVALG